MTSEEQTHSITLYIVGSLSWITSDFFLSFCLFFSGWGGGGGWAPIVGAYVVDDMNNALTLTVTLTFKQDHFSYQSVIFDSSLVL